MMILITGGSASGKSRFAEELLSRSNGEKIYIAAMRPYGEEERKKIERHREMRKSRDFTAVEKYIDVAELNLGKNCSAMLECICNLTANEMFDDEGNETDVREKIIKDVLRLSEKVTDLIVVTNDVGSDLGAQYSDSTKRYIEAVGRINYELAERSDLVIEMVCGIPLILKGEKIW